MRILLLFVILLTVILVPYNEAHAGTSYYVSPTGDDDAAGTIGAPWGTLEYAVDQLTAGDTLYALSGTFTPTAQITPANNGSSGNLITIRNYPGATVGIDGTSVSAGVYTGVIRVSTDYVVIDGFNVVESDGAGISVAAGADHVTIQNCYIADTDRSGICVGDDSGSTVGYTTVFNNELCNVNRTVSQEGITLIRANNFEVSYNYIHDQPANHDPWCGIYTSQIAIDMKVACHDGTVHHNHTVGGYDGIYIDARGYSYNIDIYNNHIEKFFNVGIALGDEGNNSGLMLGNIDIYNNVIHDPVKGCTSYGIEFSHRINPPESVFLMDDIRVYNNTFYNFTASQIYNPVPLQMGGNADRDFTNIYIYNNIFWGEDPSKGSVWIVNNDYDSDNHHFYNNIYGVDGSYTGSSYFGSDYLTGTPTWVNAASGCADSDLDVLVGSNTINSGTSNGAPLFDYNDTTRPRQTLFDIGAFEYLPPGDAPPTYVSGSLPSYINTRPINSIKISGTDANTFQKIY